MLRKPAFARFDNVLYLLLGLSSLGCLALFWMRYLYTGSPRYAWMGWNLFLALIPVALTPVLAHAWERGQGVRAVALGVVWLLFFPNAPYMTTDLLLLHTTDGMPLWYDLVLLLMFAWTGLFAAFVSLALLQRQAARGWGAPAGWVFVLGVFALTGFGVYLGRFVRWNSWDVFLQPAAVARDVLQPLLHPRANWRVLAASAAFGGFFSLVYVWLAALTRWGNRA